ncbi:DEAD/DEAH box helicase, partial [Thermus sp.]|uniref:DEAD/DEAH box helicase n=1 Tax=Thermus sp. TaxID=275 RepID=UPI0025DF5DF0
MRRRGEDYDEAELAHAVDSPERNRLLGEVLGEYARHRKGVIYAAGVRHARNLAALLSSLGLSAESVHGEDPERREKLERHRRGEFQFLTNAMLLIESYDDPTINLGVMSRPTASPTLYEQALGRPARLLREGRTWDGSPKQDYLWIDLMDVGLEDRIRVWEFFGVEAVWRDEKGPPRIRTLEEPPTRAEAARAAHAELPPQFQANIPLERYLAGVDRLQAPPPFSLEAQAALWRRQPATEAQLRLLEAHGYDIRNTRWTKGDASLVIGSLEPSPRQKARLLALGYDVMTRRWNRL